MPDAREEAPRDDGEDGEGAIYIVRHTGPVYRIGLAAEASTREPCDDNSTSKTSTV